MSEYLLIFQWTETNETSEETKREILETTIETISESGVRSDSF